MSRIPKIVAGVHALYERADIRFPKSAWFRDPGFEAYLRVGQRLVDGHMGVWLTISNMNARKYRQGYMREMFVFCEAFTAERPVFQGVFVESLLAPEIRPFLTERGYRKIAGTDPFGDGMMANYVRVTPATAEESPRPVSLSIE
jgi:hypothetical protein